MWKNLSWPEVEKRRVRKNLTSPPPDPLPVPLPLQEWRPSGCRDRARCPSAGAAPPRQLAHRTSVQ